MKKRVLAVLLAVCMIVGMGVLAYAANAFSVGNQVMLKSGDALTANNLKAAVPGTDYEIKIKATPSDKISLDKVYKGAKIENLEAKIVDQLFTFTGGKKFAGELENYFTVSGDLNDTATIKFAPKTDAKQIDVYEVVNTPITDEEVAGTKTLDANGKETVTPVTLTVGNSSTDRLKEAKKNKYTMDADQLASGVTVSVKEWSETLRSLTMGLRFFGSNYENLNADEIAFVKATINRSDNKQNNYTTYANVVYDLGSMDTVTVETYLKDKADKSFYAFYGFVDSTGKVLKTASQTYKALIDGVDHYEYTVPADVSAVYAAYIEKADRITISYSSEGSGEIKAFTDDREITKIGGGTKNMISVMTGRDVTFTFVPKEGWEVRKVIIDKGTSNQKVITSFANIDFSSGSNLVKTIRQMIAATYKDEIGGQQESGTYTFDDLTVDKCHRTFYVEFAEVEPIKAPSGLDMPTVAAEGLTLATGAAAENGSNAANGNGDSNGASTTVPAENGAAGNGGSAVSGVVNPATGSTGAVAVFAVLSVAAGAAFVTAKKKED